ncbi:MAG: hypothetical protein GY778_14640, partial [bacterium]|nr:hypothetical protein [bacterium]
NCRFSVYESNKQKAAEVVGKYKVGFWSEAHRAMPDHPIPGSLPSPCICPLPSYFMGRIYACPGGYLIKAKLGKRLDHPAHSAHVDEDFVDHYEAHKGSRHHEEICQWCISNGIVYEAQKHTQETPVEVTGLSMSRGRTS